MHVVVISIFEQSIYSLLPRGRHESNQLTSEIKAGFVKPLPELRICDLAALGHSPLDISFLFCDLISSPAERIVNDTTVSIAIFND
jgi:hypothetical protein